MNYKPRRKDSWLRFFAFLIIPVLVVLLANDVESGRRNLELTMPRNNY